MNKEYLIPDHPKAPLKSRGWLRPTAVLLLVGSAALMALSLCGQEVKMDNGERDVLN